MRECSGEGGMTFPKAYALYCPDVEKIAEAMGIKPHKADGLINAAMNKHTRKSIVRCLIRSNIAASISETG
jgi:hypothetical protein